MNSKVGSELIKIPYNQELVRPKRSCYISKDKVVSAVSHMTLISIFHVLIITRVIIPAYFGKDDVLDKEMIKAPLIFIYITTSLGVISFFRGQCVDL